MNIMQEEETVHHQDCAMEDRLLWSAIPWTAPGIPWTHLRRQLLPGDPFFEDGNLFYSVTVKELAAVVYEELKTNFAVDDFSCHFSGCNKVFASVADYEYHYNSKHRNVCGTCKRVFPTNHLLDIHVLEWHDSMFELLTKQKNMYQCLVESCSEMFSNSTKRKKHMIELHKYPSNYRFDRPSKSNRQKCSSNATAVCSEMEVDGGKLNKKQNKIYMSPATKRQFSYKVPSTICFGQGAVRSFKSERKRGKKKHWHQTPGMECDTSVNIENVNMMDLAAAIDS